MKTTTILITAVALFSFTSCKKKGCTDITATNYSEAAEKDDGSCEYNTASNITLNFTQNFAGTDVTSADFDQLNYTNLNGDVLSVTKMQYLISDVQFYKTNGDTVQIDGYHLIDMSDVSTLTYELPKSIETGLYTGMGFTYGFDEVDNVDGAYADLNLASWSSPMMLGGGYHQLKFEGRYINNATDTISFQYHNLSTIRQIAGVDTTFHANYAHINIPSSMSLTADASIEIKMDIGEWFKSPNTWDLNTYFSMLMPNYDAQLLMTANSATVFSVGDVVQ